MIAFGLGSFLLFVQQQLNDIPGTPPPVISPPGTWGAAGRSRRKKETHGETPRGQR